MKAYKIYFFIKKFDNGHIKLLIFNSHNLSKIQKRDILTNVPFYPNYNYKK